jgi:cell division transport system permease protein
MANWFPTKREANTVARSSKVWSNVYSNIQKEKFMSFSNILVMTLTFLVFGIFIYVISISQTALRYLEQQVQLSVFFKDDFKEDAILSLKQKLESDGRISEVKYVSKEDAFKIFSEINKDEPILLQSISPSILPASLEIKAHNISDLTPLSEELSKTDGVEEVRFFKDVVQKFKVWSSVVYIVGFSLVTLFLIISYSVILNTVRTTINSKGMELEIMKLVGASDKYVKNPLIYQGTLFGLISACIAGLILLGVGLYLNVANYFANGLAFGFLPTLYVKPFIFALSLFVVLLASGFLLGYLGSAKAVRKYLKY